MVARCPLLGAWRFSDFDQLGELGSLKQLGGESISSFLVVDETKPLSRAATKATNIAGHDVRSRRSTKFSRLTFQ